MEEFECALRFMAGTLRTLVRKLWCSYSISAAAMAVSALGLARFFYYVLMPALILHSEGLPWKALVSLVSIDAFGLGLTFVGPVLWGIAAFRAHKRTIRVMAEVSLLLSQKATPAAPTSSKKTALITLSIILGIILLSILFLPFLVFGLSFAASALSGMMEEVLHVPVWSWMALMLFSFLGMFMVQFFALYLRLVFHAQIRNS